MVFAGPFAHVPSRFTDHRRRGQNIDPIDYGPLDFVAWPGNRMQSVNGLHIVTDRAHWLFLAERSDATFPLLQGP
jgi:hypothetical protein